jgi:hypothetical protein
MMALRVTHRIGTGKADSLEALLDAGYHRVTDGVEDSYHELG